MIGLMVSAFRFATDPTGWLLERWRCDRLGGERHEFYRQALVDAEAEEDVHEGEFWCNEHDTFCDHKPPYCTGCGSTHAVEQTCLRWAGPEPQGCALCGYASDLLGGEDALCEDCEPPQTGIPASGADASPPEMSGVSLTHQPSGGVSSYIAIEQLLQKHVFDADLDARCFRCWCGHRFDTVGGWSDHLTGLILQAVHNDKQAQ